MKLIKVLTESSLKYTPDFNREIDNIRKQGGKHLGSGDYGSVYAMNGKVIKITTDEIELQHAQLLKGKQTDNFVFIEDVRLINDNLGIITMENMNEFDGEIPREFVQNLEKEATQLGIDPEELDIRSSNFMIHPNTGKIKMIDV